MLPWHGRLLLHDPKERHPGWPPPGSPVCRRQSQKRNPSSRCPCSSTHPETKTPWKGHRTEMSGFRNGSKDSEKWGWMMARCVCVQKVFDSYCTASCLSETSPWNSIRGGHGTMELWAVCRSLLHHVLLHGFHGVVVHVWWQKCPNQAMTLGWTSRMKTDGWHSLKQVRCNPDVAPHLSCGRVACFWSAMSKHVQTKIGRFKFDKNDWKKTRRFPRNMDSKIWIYPETWLKPKIHSKQHGFSPSKSDVKEIFLTPWDVGHRHKTNRPWHQSPGLSEIPRLHEHHPEAKPGEISMGFLKWISSI